MLGLAGLRALCSRLPAASAARRARRPPGAAAKCQVDALEPRRLFHVFVGVTQHDDGSEGGDDGYFVITGSSGGDNNPSSMTVNFTLSGTATPGTDYTGALTTGTVTLTKTGSQAPYSFEAAPIHFTPVDDDLDEGTETVILTITPSTITDSNDPNYYAVLLQDEVDRTALIFDNDQVLPASPPIYCTDCSCNVDSLSAAEGADGGNPMLNSVSDTGVNYASGAPGRGPGGGVGGATDVGSSGGTPGNAAFGHGHGWVTDLFQRNGDNGSGVNVGRPRLVKKGTTVIALRGNNAVYFDVSGSGYATRFFVQDSLSVDGGSGDYVQTDSEGNAFRYYAPDYSVTELQGQLKSIKDVYGNLTVADYYNNSGDTWSYRKIQYLTRYDGDNVTGTVRERLEYTYKSSAPNAGKLIDVTLKRPSATTPGTWDAVQSAQYGYYSSTGTYGQVGDLQSVSTLNGNVEVSSQHYYYYPGTSLSPSLLKFVFGGPAYARLGEALQSNPSANLADYADEYIQYSAGVDPYFTYRPYVTSYTTSGSGCTSCSGGMGQYTYSYYHREDDVPNTYSYNRWLYRTLETLPDGNTNTVYSNDAGEAMLKVLTDVTTGQQWMTYYRYDDHGALALVAHPSAVTGFDEANDLVGATSMTSFEYVSDDSGLVEVYGLAEGYLVYKAQYRGDISGTSALERQFGYTRLLFPHGFRKSSETLLPTGDTGDAERTSYSYTYYPGTSGVRSMVVTRPAVTAAHNGRDSSDTEAFIYDNHGRVVWHFDEAGYADHYTYDPATGAQTQAVVDSSATYLDHVTADGPANHWRFGESSGATTAADAAGGDTLALSGASPGQTGALTGDADKAIGFNGSSGYAAGPNDPSLVLYGDLTVEAWVYLDGAPSSGQQAMIAGVGDATHNFSWSLGVTNVSGLVKPFAFHENGSGTDNLVTGATTISVNAWHHLAVIRDADEKTYRFVIDGVAETAIGYTEGPDLAADGVLNVGRSPAGSKYLYGKVDELALYDRALDPARLADHYSIGRGAVANHTPLALTTTRTADAFGRTLTETAPNGIVTTTAYDDVNHGTTVIRPGMPVEVYRENWAKGYTESLSFVSALGTIDAGSLRSLSRSVLNAAGQVVATDRYFQFDSTFTYGTGTPALGVSGTNYYRTEYKYDKRGRLHYEKNPLGTIRRSIYDARGNLTSQWVGTDDTPTSGFWPDSTAGTDLVKVADYVYDGGTSGLFAPSTPSLSDTTGGLLPSPRTYYVRVTYVDANGESMWSSESSFAVSAYSRLVVNSPASVTGAVGYNVYVSDTSGTETRQNGDTPWTLGTSWTMPVDGLVEGKHLGIGDGNFTQVTLHPSSSSADDRVTKYFYDWRNRLVASKDGAQASEDGSVNRPVYYYDLDNLGRVVAAYQYDGDGVVITTPDGVPAKPAGIKLRSLTRTAYDEQGRVYRSSVVGINQSTGVDGLTDVQVLALPSLHTDYWYDARGNLIKTLQAGGLVQKSAYDTVGRLTKAYLSDGGADTTWAHANDVLDDKVLEQTEYTYDAAGNVTLTTLRQRFDGIANLGELGNPTTDPKARVSYTASYYDASDRLIAVADHGTNGGAAFIRAATAPGRDVLTGLAGSGTTTTLVDTRREENTAPYDDYFVGFTLTITGGTGSGQSRTVSDYNPLTKTFTVSSAFSTAPGSGSTYTLTRPLSGTATSGSTTTLVDTGRSESTAAYDDYFVGYTIKITSGTGAGQTAVVTDYNYSTKTFTVSPAFTTAPGSGSGYSLTPNALVTAYSYAADEVQTVTLAGPPTAGTFTLTFNGQTTAAIAYNATPAAVQSALQALSGIGSGNVAVIGAARGPYTIRFTGTLAGTDVAQVTANGGGLSGGSISVATESPGGDNGRVQSVTDPRGLVSKTDYDIAGRTTRTVSAFADGVPSAADDQVTQYGYDGLDHVLTMTAFVASGTFQTTQYLYGVTAAGGNNLTSNDLLREVQYPDKTSGSPGTAASDKNDYKYNALGQAKEMTDQNETVHAYSYDAVGRFSNDAVTLKSGNPYKVSTAVLRLETSYDEAGRPYLFASYDTTPSPAVIKNQVKREFNALGQLTSEWQDHDSAVDSSSLRVRYTYSEDYANNHSRLTSVIYPDGRVLAYGYNSGLDAAVSRVSYLADNAINGLVVEQYSYLGLGTIVERIRPEAGVRLTYVKQGAETNGEAGDQYAGLDRFGRVVDQRWRKTTGTAADVDRFKYAYDKDSNRLYKENTLSSTNSELYHADGASAGYDSLNRLTQFQRGALSDTNADGVYDTVSSENRYQSYSLDAVGNWDSSSSGTSAGTATPTARQHNLDNQITSYGGVTWTNTTYYDANGNQRKDENGKGLLYDAWNRLVGFDNNNDGDSLDTNDVTYSADALGRRIARGPHPGSATDLYYSSDWQVLEERVDGYVTAQNVWGLGYVDSMVLRDTPATTGTLDPAWDGDGLRTDDLGGTDIIYDVAVQPDGKVVAAGVSGNKYAVVRYNRDGSLDTNADADPSDHFNTNGKLIGGTANNVFNAVALQNDGKIVAVGGNGTQFLVIRINANGTLDTTFGGTGIVTTPVGTGNATAYDVAVQPDGKIVVAGASGSSFALARYTDTGALDTSFDSDGKLTTNVFGNNGARAVAIDPSSGKIVAVGDNSGGGAAAVRYNGNNGALDTSFGSGGIANIYFGAGLAAAEAVGVQSDGKVVVGGYAWNSTDSTYDFYIARFTSGGAADTSFDTDGIVKTEFNSAANDHALDLQVTGDGRIVAVGKSNTGGNNDFAIARYQANGSLDATFGGSGGTTRLDFASSNDIAYAVALLPGGGVVAAGTSGNNFAVVRYGQRLYAQQDANFNVTSITDVNGAVQERYLYDPYGAVTYKTAAWGARGSSSYSWVYLHQGGRYDGSSKLYNSRWRDYSPNLGRYTRVDPLRYAAGGANFYEHIASSPVSSVDPFGLAPKINDVDNPDDYLLNPDGSMTTNFDQVIAQGAGLGGGLTRVNISFDVVNCKTGESSTNAPSGTTNETIWTTAGGTGVLEFVIGGRGRFVGGLAQDRVVGDADRRQFQNETNQGGTRGYMLVTLETRRFEAAVAPLPAIRTGDLRSQNTIRHDLLVRGQPSSTTAPPQWNTPPLTTQHSGILVVWNRCCDQQWVSVISWGAFGNSAQAQFLK